MREIRRPVRQGPSVSSQGNRALECFEETQLCAGRSWLRNRTFRSYISCCAGFCGFYYPGHFRTFPDILGHSCHFALRQTCHKRGGQRVKTIHMLEERHEAWQGESVIITRLPCVSSQDDCKVLQLPESLVLSSSKDVLPESADGSTGSPPTDSKRLWNRPVSVARAFSFLGFLSW